MMTAKSMLSKRPVLRITLVLFFLLKQNIDFAILRKVCKKSLAQRNVLFDLNSSVYYFMLTFGFSLCTIILLRLSLVQQRHGLAVPRAGDRSYVTGSIRGWSRSQLTYLTGGC